MSDPKPETNTPISETEAASDETKDDETDEIDAGDGTVEDLGES